MGRNRVYAAIDIGSNAARMLIKEYLGLDDRMRPELKKLLMVRVPLRLGADVFGKGKISATKRKNILRLMKAYSQLMKIYRVDEMRACATSAMRDAVNGREIIEDVARSTGINIEIISGDDEARIIFNNRLECVNDEETTALFMDVGGGSTELNLLSQCELKYSDSFNIGTVRILAGKVVPSEYDRFVSALRGIHAGYGNVQLIGSGGNINKIYKMLPGKDVRDKSVGVDDVRKLYEALRPLTVGERMARYDLRPDRADVIVPAAELFLRAADELEARRILVPKIGVADGIIDGMVIAGQD